VSPPPDPRCARPAASQQLSALAEKERELAAARQRAAALEAELAEVERECALRQAQEAALKEAVRDLQREMERQRLPGRTGAGAGVQLWGEGLGRR
jgi:RNA 3'-terminal phosphate cyclase